LENESTKTKNQLPPELILYYQKYNQIKKMSGLQMRLPFTSLSFY